MNAEFVFGIVLLVSAPSAAQAPHRPPTSPKQTLVAPDCPEGLGCRTFKQMWDSGDSVARSATWACFIQKDLTYVPFAPEKDVVFFLRDGASVFEMHYFTNGIESVSSEAHVEDSRGNVVHWIREDRPTSLDVTKSDETLIMNLQFTNTEQAIAHFYFTMRLSSGRFESEWTTEKKGWFSTTTSKDNYAGQCISIPKLTK